MSQINSPSTCRNLSQSGGEAKINQPELRLEASPDLYFVRLLIIISLCYIVCGSTSLILVTFASLWTRQSSFTFSLYHSIIMFSCLRLFIALQFLCFHSQIIYLPSISLHCCYCFISSSDSSNTYGYSSTSFIFSLINKEGLAPFKSTVKYPKNAIYKRKSYGPTFGGGLEIYISNNANSNTKSYTHLGGGFYSVPSGVQNTQTILVGSFNFTPDEVEVFYLTWVTLLGDHTMSNRLKRNC